LPAVLHVVRMMQRPRRALLRCATRGWLLCTPQLQLFDLISPPIRCTAADAERVGVQVQEAVRYYSAAPLAYPPLARARAHLCSSPCPHARTHGRTWLGPTCARRRPRCCEPAGAWLGANLRRDSWYYYYYDAFQSIQGLSSLIAATSCRRLHAQASEVWGHHGEHAACLDHARALDGPEDVVYAPPVRCASAHARACVRACMARRVRVAE
jgi:hypothetical protein